MLFTKKLKSVRILNGSLYEIRDGIINGMAVKCQKPGEPTF